MLPTEATIPQYAAHLVFLVERDGLAQQLEQAEQRAAEVHEEYQAIGREVYRCREALAESEVDARWIVGQWQRLRDEPLKEVALKIVDRIRAALTPDEGADLPVEEEG